LLGPAHLHAENTKGKTMTRYLQEDTKKDTSPRVLARQKESRRTWCQSSREFPL
ncbi:hypothetical protein J6590_101186, partial [Homalodisca vitripennis]